MKGIFSLTKVVVGNASGFDEMLIAQDIAVSRLAINTAFLGNAGAYFWVAISLTAVDTTLILSAAMNQQGILLTGFGANSSPTNYASQVLSYEPQGTIHFQRGTRLKLYALHSGGTLVTTQFTVVGVVA